MRPKLRSARALLGVLLLFVSACTVPENGSYSSEAPFDPFEDNNRSVHRFNLAVDRALFRPASRGYTDIIPDPIEDSFNNFSANLSEPGDTANYLVQGKIKLAGLSLVRFIVNTTIGFAGLANPASDFGLPETETDFGETLAVWGLPEGAYVELPFFGPSTQRDAVGVFVDFFTNPLTFAPQRPIENIGVWAGLLERLSDRGRYSDTVDSILYESEDSYAVARTIFLQNRRFELEGNDGDSYVDPYSDLYSDVYEDPYAE